MAPAPTAQIPTHAPPRHPAVPSSAIWVVLPFSEVCIHMSVAGVHMWVEPKEKQMAQLWMVDGKQFGGPITMGEAGVHGADFPALNQCAVCGERTRRSTEHEWKLDTTLCLMHFREVTDRHADERKEYLELLLHGLTSVCYCGRRFQSKEDEYECEDCRE